MYGILGAIVGAALSWFLGYLQPGAFVGAGGVAVHGGVASLGLSALLAALGSVAGSARLKNLFDRLGKPHVLPPDPGKAPPETDKAVAYTAKVSDSILFFRTLLKSDDEAQVLIDELLVRSTRICSGVDPVPDFTVSIEKSGGVKFGEKKTKAGE